MIKKEKITYICYITLKIYSRLPGLKIKFIDQQKGLFWNINDICYITLCKIENLHYELYKIYCAYMLYNIKLIDDQLRYITNII